MDIDFASVSSRDHIKSQCRLAQETRSNLISAHDYTNLVVKLSASVVVKFGIGVTTAEGRALEFASANLDPTIVKVPTYLQFFSSVINEFWTTGYLVMEFVEGPTLEHFISVDEQLVAKILQAIRHLQSFRNTRPGPLDGGHAHGLLWSEYSSGQSFPTTEDLQSYLNARLSYRNTRLALDVVNVTQCLCHMDIAPRNIIVGPGKTTCLIDWGCAGFYPSSFELWAVMFESIMRSSPILSRVASALQAEASPGELADLAGLDHVYSANQAVSFPNAQRDRETEYFMSGCKKSEGSALATDLSTL